MNNFILILFEHSNIRTFDPIINWLLIITCHSPFSESVNISLSLHHIQFSYNNIFTVRNSNCGKVMFLHLSVSHSVRREVSGQTPSRGRHPPLCRQPSQVDTPLGRHPLGRTPLGRHPPGRHTPPRLLLQRTVRILLECILVLNYYYSLTILTFR